MIIYHEVFYTWFRKNWSIITHKTSWGFRLLPRSSWSAPSCLACRSPSRTTSTADVGWRAATPCSHGIFLTQKFQTLLLFVYKFNRKSNDRWVSHMIPILQVKNHQISIDHVTTSFLGICGSCADGTSDFRFHQLHLILRYLTVTVNFYKFLTGSKLQQFYVTSMFVPTSAAGILGLLLVRGTAGFLPGPADIHMVTVVTAAWATGNGTLSPIWGFQPPWKLRPELLQECHGKVISSTNFKINYDKLI